MKHSFELLNAIISTILLRLYTKFKEINVNVVMTRLLDRKDVSCNWRFKNNIILRHVIEKHHSVHQLEPLPDNKLMRFISKRAFKI